MRRPLCGCRPVDQRRERYEAALVAAGSGLAVTTGHEFAALAAELPARRTNLAAQIGAVDTDLAQVAGELDRLNRTAAETRDELASLSNRTSNLPGSHTVLRARLCNELGLDEADLPFAEELVDVAETHARWRGPPNECCAALPCPCWYHRSTTTRWPAGSTADA